MDNKKWVAVFGNSPSVTEHRLARYTKDITFRYYFKSTFNGNAFRIHFSNFCGKEDITISQSNIATAIGAVKIDPKTVKPITFDGKNSVTIPAGQEVVSDEIPFEVTSNGDYFVSYYLSEITEMATGISIQGPLVHNFYAYGNHLNAEEMPIEKRISTSYYHFLNTVDVKTERTNNALVIFGDSITAQSYPDYITLYLLSKGLTSRSVIRRGVSGSRVLGEYNAASYAAYGLCGEKRFEYETDVDGCDKIVVLHGINDIIHPDGINPFRPMSNFPTLLEMINGYRFYINIAKSKGKKIYFATLAPIKGWRTYKPFRDELRNSINKWIRTTDEIDGFIDIDKAIRDDEDINSMKPIYDLGDHLHPSTEGAKKMALEFNKIL